MAGGKGGAPGVGKGRLARDRACTVTPTMRLGWSRKATSASRYRECDSAISWLEGAVGLRRRPSTAATTALSTTASCASETA